MDKSKQEIKAVDSERRARGSRTKMICLHLHLHGPFNRRSDAASQTHKADFCNANAVFGKFDPLLKKPALSYQSLTAAFLLRRFVRLMSSIA